MVEIWLPVESSFTVYNNNYGNLLDNVFIYFLEHVKIFTGLKSESLEIWIHYNSQNLFIMLIIIQITGNRTLS